MNETDLISYCLYILDIVDERCSYLSRSTRIVVDSFDGRRTDGDNARRSPRPSAAEPGAVRSDGPLAPEGFDTGRTDADGNTFVSPGRIGVMDTTATVSSVETVGRDTYALRFDAPDGFAAEPGQFVKLGTEIDGESVARFYTLSSPTVGDSFEVTVGIDPDEGGEFSAFLADAEAGTEMTLSGPFGDQHYDGEPRAVVIAGGPGVGPAVAIAERPLDDGAEAAVVYRDDDVSHADRLDRLEERGAAIRLLDADEPLDDAVAEALTGSEGETVFVYGFADLVADAEAAIEAAGGDADAAKVENFG
jgi:ferredoxin-NADP reductase